MTHSVEVPEYQVQAGVRVDPSRTVLLIGDMQNDFVKEGGTLVVGIRERDGHPVIEGIPNPKLTLDHLHTAAKRQERQSMRSG